MLATGSNDKTIKLWNPQTGALIETLTGHTSLVNSVAFSADYSTLASGGEDKTIRLWNLDSKTLIRTLNGHVEPVGSVTFGSAAMLVSGSADQTAKIWQP